MANKYGFPLTSVIGISMGVAILTSLVIVGIARADSLPHVEINISGNGNAHVSGAEVTAVSSNSVNAKTSWGSTVLGWIVNADSDTNVVADDGHGASLADIAVGDIISFRGTIDSAATNLTVKAKSVKDWSKAEAKTKLNGVVTSINSTVGSFTILRGNSTTTVQTNGSTKFSTDGKSSTFADLFLNAKVKIAGMFNASSSVFTASSVDVASSTRNRGKDKNDKHEWRDWMRSRVWLRIWNR